MDGLRKLLADEAKAYEEMRALASERGPIYAYLKVANGELGGPILRGYAQLSRVIPFGGLGSPLSVLALPLIVVVAALLGANWTIHHEALAWQILLVVVLIAASLGASALLFVLALGRTRAALWRRVGRWSFFDLFTWGSLIIVFPAVGFAALSALLVGLDRIDVKGATPEDGDLATATFETFIWNFLDALPLLKVPETLNWQPGLEFTTWSGGSLVLAYKIAVILPFAQLVAAMLARVFGESGEGARDEAGPPADP